MAPSVLAAASNATACSIHAPALQLLWRRCNPGRRSSGPPPERLVSMAGRIGGRAKCARSYPRKAGDGDARAHLYSRQAGRGYARQNNRCRSARAGMDCEEQEMSSYNRLGLPLGMRIPYVFGPLPVIGDNARSVARRAAPFILGALINNTFSVAFRADFFSHLSAVPSPIAGRSAGRAGSPAP